MRIEKILPRLCYALFLLFFITLTPEVIAQGSTQVKGLVQSSKNEPLSRVSVVIRNTKTNFTSGTSTDSSGVFNFSNIPSGGPFSFTFSMIGYTSQTLAGYHIQEGTTLSLVVKMQESAEVLTQVVVTALGITRQAKSLGYSTSTINMDQVDDNRSTNVGNSLVGKVSGLNVSPLTGGPGGSSKIRIRGQSSFGGNNSPLIVVNGVPINNTSVLNNSRSDGGDGLQSIDPDDIETMTVLKGAVAAALYGFRAKDGAIIITTKSGSKSTGIGIEYNMTFQTERALDYTDYQYEYGQGENGHRPTTMAEAQSSGTWSFGEKFDGAPTIQADGSTHPYLPYKNRIRDFFRTGTNFTNSLALSGGNEKGSFRLSFTNTDANSIMRNSDFHKKILNFGLVYNFTPRFSTQVNINYSNEYNRNPVKIFGAASSNETIYAVANSIPLEVLKNYENPDGSELRLSRFTSKTNPYWVINKHFENSRRDRIFGNAQLRYKFNDWLYVQGRVGQDYFTRPYESNLPTGQANAGSVTTGFNGRYEQYVSTFRELNLDFLAVATKTYGDFGVSITAGGNQMSQVNTNLGTAVRNLYVKGLYTIGNGQIITPSYAYAEKKVNSLYGSADLSFKNYLYLNLTGRNDWFSTLNPKSNSYLYPSASTSFVFSDAFASIRPSWLNYGKLRIAYAEVGGDTDPYQDALFYLLNAATLNGSALGDMTTAISPNANLRPLKVKEIEAGIELRTLKSRLNFDISVYNKHTVDEILNVDISQASGYSQTKVNIGELRNKGIEMLVTIVPVKGVFTWETVFNGAYNESKVLKLANGQLRFDVGTAPDATLGTVSQEVGKPLASLRVYDYKRDAKGQPILSSGLPLQGNIITAGSGIPKWTGAWQNTITYKGFRVFTQVDFKAGAKMISASNYNNMRFGLSKETLTGREGGVIFDGVNADGTPNTKAVPAEQFYTSYSDGYIGIINVFDASFIRWRTISVSYDLSRIARNTFIKRINVGLSCNNVLMIKKFVPNIDPEAVSVASDNTVGMEFYSLPTTRTFGLNLNVKL